MRRPRALAPVVDRGPAWAAALAALAQHCAHEQRPAAPACACPAPAPDPAEAHYCGDARMDARPPPGVEPLPRDEHAALCATAERAAASALPAPDPPHLARADAAVVAACRARRCVSWLRADALRDRDVIKVQCEQDKLTQLDVALRSIVERRDALARALDANATAEVAHERTVLQVLVQRVEQLRSEAHQCIGGGPMDVCALPVNSAGRRAPSARLVRWRGGC